MYQAIVTKFVSPTDKRPARVIVTADAGRLTVSWDHALGVPENHAAAARAFAEKYSWSGDWVGGTLPGNGYVFVMASGRIGASFTIAEGV